MTVRVKFKAAVRETASGIT